MFIFNFIPAVVLFKYVALHSFISLMFSNNLNNAIRNLEHSLRVEIIDDRTVKASKVYRSCFLRIGDNSFPINLILIPM